MNPKEVTLAFEESRPVITQTFRVTDEFEDETISQGGRRGLGALACLSPRQSLFLSLRGWGRLAPLLAPPLTSVSGQPSDIGYTFVFLLVGMCVVQEADYDGGHAG